MIKVIFVENLSSNVNIISKLMAEVQSLRLGKLRYGQERVDILRLLLAPEVLGGNVHQSDEVGGEVPAGGVVDHVPLLGVDLPAVCLNCQLCLRHRP